MLAILVKHSIVDVSIEIVLSLTYVWLISVKGYVFTCKISTYMDKQSSEKITS